MKSLNWISSAWTTARSFPRVRSTASLSILGCFVNAGMGPCCCASRRGRCQSSAVFHPSESLIGEESWTDLCQAPSPGSACFSLPGPLSDWVAGCHWTPPASGPCPPPLKHQTKSKDSLSKCKNRSHSSCKHDVVIIPHPHGVISVPTPPLCFFCFHVRLCVCGDSVSSSHQFQLLQSPHPLHLKSAAVKPRFFTRSSQSVATPHRHYGKPLAVISLCLECDRTR